jgi:hypothetical protein
MQTTRWIVELVLPEGTFEARSILTDGEAETLDAEAQAAVVELLAGSQEAAPMSSPTDSNAGQQAESSRASQRRLLLAHSVDSAVAHEIAIELAAMFPGPVSMWNQGMRIEFIEFMQKVFERTH